jgi:hypothetical protein
MELKDTNQNNNWEMRAFCDSDYAGDKKVKKANVDLSFTFKDASIVGSLAAKRWLLFPLLKQSILLGQQCMQKSCF